MQRQSNQMAKSLTNLTHLQRVRVLYKTILRFHRGLPKELGELGNNYTRDEFKRHKNCNPQEASVFMIEWAKYAVGLSEQLLKGKTKGPIGSNLNEDVLNQFRDEQIVQLYELMMAAKGENDLPENSDQIGKQEK